jgi:hypothetical protein
MNGNLKRALALHSACDEDEELEAAQMCVNMAVLLDASEMNHERQRGGSKLEEV